MSLLNCSSLEQAVRLIFISFQPEAGSRDYEMLSVGACAFVMVLHKRLLCYSFMKISSPYLQNIYGHENIYVKTLTLDPFKVDLIYFTKRAFYLSYC